MLIGIKHGDITQNTFAYTNHTLLPEALEKWSMQLFASLLPRHLEIIYEINSRFLDEVRNLYPDDNDILQASFALLMKKEKDMYGWHILPAVGSHAVNGVSALHTELMKTDVLHDFYKISPEKFLNVPMVLHQEDG